MPASKVEMFIHIANLEAQIREAKSNKSKKNRR